jgi:hypothetical protein
LESSDLQILRSWDIQIFENNNKYYSCNRSKMIKNLDFEIGKHMEILVIIFVLASGVIISNVYLECLSRMLSSRRECKIEFKTFKSFSFQLLWFC